MKAKLGILVGAICISALMIGCGRTSTSLQVKGSDTMVNLGQSWAEELMKANPNTRIAITGGGSGVGIAALIDGTTDIAQASRAMKPEEMQAVRDKGGDPREFEVAVDALTVIVNKANPVSKLTIRQLGDIFTGRITNWRQVGGKDQKIVLLSRDKNSGTHVFFLEHVLRGGDPKGPEEYAKSALFLPSSQQIAEQVTRSPGAIGYVGLGYYNKARHKAVAIAISPDAPYVVPSVRTARSGEYPISRPLYLYTARPPSGAAKAFIDYARSPEGQRIVTRMGFVPVTAQKAN